MKTILILLMLLPFTGAAMFDDFENGFDWECQTIPWADVQPYLCHAELTNQSKVGNYAVALGQVNDVKPTKFYKEISFRRGEWYGAWMMESSRGGDHSMFELNKRDEDASALIRPIEDKFKAYSVGGYLEMEGQCEMQPMQWYFLRLRQNTKDEYWDAEVYNANAELICYLYDYQGRTTYVPTRIRLLGDELVPITYWDGVTIGNEIPMDGEVPEPFCGDGTCNVNETCFSCENDCGICEPNVCEETQDYEVEVQFSFTRTFTINTTNQQKAIELANAMADGMGFSYNIVSVS